MNIDFQQLRTFSILSETPQYIDRGKEGRYVTFIGYVIPYSAFSVIFMWALCGAPIYQHIWSEQTDVIKEIKELNTHDLELQNVHDSSIGIFMMNKFKEKMNGLSPDTIENMFNNMFLASETTS